MIKKYDIEAMRRKARESEAYWIEKTLLQFSEEIIAEMEHDRITRSELASRIGVSPAYITKILRGTANFTLESMVKISRALGYELQTHLQPKGMESRWFDIATREKEQKHESKTGEDLYTFKSHYTHIELSEQKERDNDRLALAS